MCALDTVTKLEPTRGSLVRTCVWAIRAIKIPLHRATADILSVCEIVIYQLNLP